MLKARYDWKKEKERKRFEDFDDERLLRGVDEGVCIVLRDADQEGDDHDGHNHPRADQRVKQQCVHISRDSLGNEAHKRQNHKNKQRE